MSKALTEVKGDIKIDELNQGTLKGGMTDTGQWKLEQDITAYLQNAKHDRDAWEHIKDTKEGKSKTMRKMCTIPDIIGIEIREKHGLDIYAQDFGHHHQNGIKLRAILQTHYPELLIAT